MASGHWRRLREPRGTGRRAADDHQALRALLFEPLPQAGQGRDGRARHGACRAHDLQHGEDRFELRFDCKPCEMHVVGRMQKHVLKALKAEPVSFYRTRPQPSHRGVQNPPMDAWHDTTHDLCSHDEAARPLPCASAPSCNGHAGQRATTSTRSTGPSLRPHRGVLATRNSETGALDLSPRGDAGAAKLIEVVDDGRTLLLPTGAATTALTPCATWRPTRDRAALPDPRRGRGHPRAGAVRASAPTPSYATASPWTATADAQRAGDPGPQVLLPVRACIQT